MNLGHGLVVEDDAEATEGTLDDDEHHRRDHQPAKSR
jgi:hypothetical protein